MVVRPKRGHEPGYVHTVWIRFRTRRRERCRTGADKAQRSNTSSINGERGTLPVVVSLSKVMRGEFDLAMK